MNSAPVLDIKEAIKYFIANAKLQINQEDMAIPYMEGSPGIGKSQFLASECKQNGMGFMSMHLSLVPIEEIGGLPIYKEIEFDNKKVTGTEWSKPDIITKIYELSKNHKENIVLLDDFHMSSPAHLALGYEMFTERKLRDFKIPNNVAFVLAGNDSAKSGAKQMFGAIMNRLAVHKVVPNFTQWVNDFAIKNNVNQKIISFLRNEINRSYFLEEESTNQPWASPRSWTRFSNMLNTMEKYIKSLTYSDILYIAYGHVGPQASSEFISYYELYSKTEMDKVFSKKTEIVIPSSNNDRYIYGIAASNEYTNLIMEETKNKEQVIDIACDIIIGIGKTNAEISVAMLKNISDYAKVLKHRKQLYVGEMFKKIKEKSPDINSKISESLDDIVTATN